MTGPVARRVYQSDVLTRYVVTWPSTIRKQGRAYFATTYPNSDHVFMETAVKQRPVSSLVGRRILPEIKAAIAAAEGNDHDHEAASQLPDPRHEGANHRLRVRL